MGGAGDGGSRRALIKRRGGYSCGDARVAAAGQPALYLCVLVVEACAEQASKEEDEKPSGATVSECGGGGGER